MIRTYCDICDKELSEKEIIKDTRIEIKIKQTDKHPSSDSYYRDSRVASGKFNIDFTAKNICQKCLDKVKKQLWLVLSNKFKSDEYINSESEKIVSDNERLTKQNEELTQKLADAGFEKIKKEYDDRIQSLTQTKDRYYKDYSDEQTKNREARTEIDKLSREKQSDRSQISSLQNQLECAMRENEILKNRVDGKDVVDDPTELGFEQQNIGE